MIFIIPTIDQVGQMAVGGAIILYLNSYVKTTEWYIRNRKEELMYKKKFKELLKKQSNPKKNDYKKYSVRKKMV